MSRTRRITIVAAGVLALLGQACGGGRQAQREDASDPGNRTVRVGSIDSPESEIVAQMYIRVLDDTGYDVDPAPGFASQEELRAALEAGEVEIAPLYLASLADELDPPAGTSGNPAAVAASVAPILAERDLAILDPAPANSGEALVVAAETAQRIDLRTVSDLASAARELRFGAPPQCREAATCLPGLRDTYGIEFGGFRALKDPAEALERGDIDVAWLPGTSARIREERWFVLEDDRQLQPPENITPVARTDALNDEIEQLLNAVSASISLGHLTLYNRSFEFGESPGTLAILHLNNARLLGGVTAGSRASVGDAPPGDCEDATGTSVVKVTAEESTFLTGCFVVSRNQRIEFINGDEATPHTFTISRDARFRPPFPLDLDDPLGGQTVTSGVVGQTVESGGWLFFCRYHTYMAGEIWVA